jgi:chromosome segregation protein
MYLKSLTSRGFKSFAEKVTLDFEPGISVIVGPNGSGKSNVADAVLWVLGEQSPRNLRGSRMEDVIFAGSATRQPLSMAEVCLSFDNRNGDIRIDFPEVVVTRRIFRTGESEYLLNKTACRLVDIQELLSDLGVGRELTAVISQNKLETILRGQPEDRRAFIEEAAGLRKHRRRKEKALRKMEGMERNLVRVKDIMSEVNKQLRPLERQAKHAREYQALAAEIRELSIRILVAELQELKGQWDNRRQEEENLARELEETTASIKEGKERLGGLETELRNLRQVLEKCRTREMRLLSLGERLRSCERLGEERLKLYAALGGEMGYGDAGWSSRREELARKRAGLEEESRKTEEEICRLEGEERRRREEKKALGGELGRARRERDNLRRSWSELRERVREVRESRRKVWERADECRAASFGLQEERTGLEGRLGGLREEMHASGRKIEKAEKRRVEIEGKMAAARGDIGRFREELEAVSRKQRRYYQDEALVVARLRALQEVFSTRLDYASAAARVLEKGEDLPGILGMLLHRIRVSEEWEKALESYLGPWLFCVVTRSLNDAVEAIRFLKRGEEGYGVFLPLSEISTESLDEAKNLAHIVGGTPALDVVECDDDIRPALEYLLGDVVLCSSLEEAGDKAELYPKLTFVTSEGDIIAPRRAVKGGARPRSQFHVIARRREIEQLQEMLDLCDEESISLEVQRKSTLATIAGLERDVERMEIDRKEVEAELRELDIASREKGLQGERVEEELAELAERAGGLEEERRELRTKAVSLDVEAAALAGVLEALSPLRSRGEDLVERLRERERELDEALQVIRASGASLVERRFHLEERIKELSQEAAGPSLPGREELAEMSQAQEEMLELAGRLIAVHQGWEEKVNLQEEEDKEELSRKEEELDDLRGRQEEREIREGELRELVHNRDLAAAQLKMRVDMLVQRLLDEYRLPLETAVTDYLPTSPVEEMRGELERLEHRREMLGQVNLRAVEEHQALKERYDFLVEQVEDLRESKASLLKVVRAIDREIVRIFKETYEEVNQHFQELFEMLFPQGRAELTLSDPTDLLNTGVDVEAQPRGKRLKKLSLLSGGETALISLAFLFAIFKTRPSPFYFLDEVEAALDDVNLHRFLNMLKEFKGDSQLVIITHQKRTMEIADVLYGVSMQASGISRIVSQRLDEAQQLARTGTA